MVGTDASHICRTDALQKNQLHVNRNLLTTEGASKYCFNMRNNTGVQQRWIIQSINPDNT